MPIADGVFVGGIAALGLLYGLLPSLFRDAGLAMIGVIAGLMVVALLAPSWKALSASPLIVALALAAWNGWRIRGLAQRTAILALIAFAVTPWLVGGR